VPSCGAAAEPSGTWRAAPLLTRPPDAKASPHTWQGEGSPDAALFQVVLAKGFPPGAERLLQATLLRAALSRDGCVEAGELARLSRQPGFRGGKPSLRFLAKVGLQAVSYHLFFFSPKEIFLFF